MSPLVIEKPDVYTVRALLNDNAGFLSPDYIQIYLDIAAKNIPYIAAALIAMSKGSFELAEMLLRFSGAAKLPEKGYDADDAASRQDAT